jgi:hypothetical protein
MQADGLTPYQSRLQSCWLQRQCCGAAGPTCGCCEAVCWQQQSMGSTLHCCLFLFFIPYLDVRWMCSCRLDQSGMLLVVCAIADQLQLYSKPRSPLLGFFGLIILTRMPQVNALPFSLCKLNRPCPCQPALWFAGCCHCMQLPSCA